MRSFHRDVNTPDYVPDFMAKSILDIDFAELKKTGVKFIAFDVDSTLVPFRGVEIDNSTLNYLLNHKKDFKKWCIATNRITNDMDKLSDALDVDVIQASLFVRKPQAKFFKRVIRYFNASPEEIAMVGDKLRADVWGAKRAGMVTIWVEHLGKDNLFDRLTGLRTIEKNFLKSFL